MFFKIWDITGVHMLMWAYSATAYIPKYLHFHQAKLHEEMSC